MLFSCGIGEDSLRVPWTARRSNQSILKRSVLGVHWKDWCWSWNCNNLATWFEELTHWKRLWCWEGLRAGGEGDDRVWDGWMASLARWMWVWVNSGSWWWKGRPGVLRFIGSQRVGHNWATELNWTESLCLNHKELWKILKKMGTCRPRRNMKEYTFQGPRTIFLDSLEHVIWQEYWPLPNAFSQLCAC